MTDHHGNRSGDPLDRLLQRARPDGPPEGLVGGIMAAVGDPAYAQRLAAEDMADAARGPLLASVAALLLAVGLAGASLLFGGPDPAPRRLPAPPVEAPQAPEGTEESPPIDSELTIEQLTLLTTSSSELEEQISGLWLRTAPVEPAPGTPEPDDESPRSERDDRQERDR